MLKTASKQTAVITPHKVLLYDKACETAAFFGFSPLSGLMLEKSDRDLAKPFTDHFLTRQRAARDIIPLVEEKISLMRLCAGKSIAQAQPAMVYHEGNIASDRGKKDTAKRINLDIIGSGRGVAEALLIETTVAILEEEGYSDLTVELNSVGDKDSFLRFNRELTNFYRKNIQELPGQCRQTLKKDVFELLSCPHEKCAALSKDAPKAVGFLSEQGRLHFKEVLEYLESLNIPYALNNSLISNRECCTHTVFQIKSLSDEKSGPLALGIRYNGLGKRIGFKKEVPATGVTICFESKKKSSPSIVFEKLKTPRFYLVQVGPEAKLKSLRVIDMLRRENIALYHSLVKDKLGAQLGSAENLNVPYILIMGQKESHENTVIVRNMATRSQDTVAIPTLVAYLKKLK